MNKLEEYIKLYKKINAKYNIKEEENSYKTVTVITQKGRYSFLFDNLGNPVYN